MAIKGVKLIFHNVQGISEPDDPSYPFKLVVVLKPVPGDFFFESTHADSERVTIRAMTVDDLDIFLTVQNLRRHPRLKHFLITGPTGIVEEIKR